MLETYQSSSNNLLLNPDQFVDAAYTPSLLANHGTGSGRGARLELLDEEPTTPPVADRQPPPEDIDRTSPTDIDLHAPPCRHGLPCAHGSATWAGVADTSPAYL
jgi:hypothetical protein